MLTRHSINDLFSIVGINIEYRCTCGVLLVSHPLIGTGHPRMETAFDQHMINVLETQWVHQFYQEV